MSAVSLAGNSSWAVSENSSISPTPDSQSLATIFEWSRIYCHSLFSPPVCTCLHSIPICGNFLPKMLLANGFSPLLSHQLQYCWYNTLRLGLFTLFPCQDAI